MPVGTFFGDPDNTSTRGGGGTSGSLTGPGPVSQPKQSYTPQFGADYQQPAPFQPVTSTPGLPKPTFNPRNVGLFGFMDPTIRPSASQQLSQQAVGGNPLSGARSLIDSYYGPQSSLLSDTLARQREQLGLVGVNADADRASLTRDAALDREALGLQRANIGLDREALGVDRTQTAGQIANLDKLKGILAKQFGLAREDLDVQLANLGIDEAKLKDMAGRQKFDLRSNLTARGAFNTVANDRGTGRIDRDLIYGLGQIGNARKQADIGYRGNVLGLTEKGIGYDNQGLGLNARLSNIGIDNRRLDNALAKVGLDEQGLGNALEDGLRAIGLGEYTSLNGLIDAIGGTNVQQAELARTILDALVGYSGLPPDVLAALMPSLGIGNPNGTNAGVPGGTSR